MGGFREEFNISYSHVDKHVDDGLGGKVALYSAERAIDYAGLQSLVNRAGNALLEGGVNANDRVLIALPDKPEHVAFFVGAMKIGAVPFNVNYQSTSSQIEFFLNDSRAKVAVMDDAVVGEYSRAKDRLKFPNKEIVLHKGCEDIGDRSSQLNTAERTRNDPAYIVYTSGTTGRPHAAVHRNGDLEFCALTYAENVLHATNDDVFYSTSKLSFSYGRVGGMHMPLMLGAAVVLDDRRPSPEIMHENIRKFDVTLFFSVPTFYNRILNQTETIDHTREFQKLRLCISAGEPLPSVIYHKWIERFGVELLDGYGSSEAEFICISQLPGRVKLDCSGKLLPGWEAVIVDSDGKKITKADTPGTLLIKSPSIATHLHEGDIPKEEQHDNWFNTMDMFKFDSNGYCYFIGRADDMFKSNGIWVSPSKVENVLLHHPSVEEVAVVGMPDESGLVKSTAFIVLKKRPTSSDDLKAEIRGLARQYLHSYEVPASISFVEQLPKTVSGKVQRYLLRSQTKH